jgi:hypothetical protein
MMAKEVRSSACNPKVMVPMQMSVTTMPLLPSLLLFMRGHGRKARAWRKSYDEDLRPDELTTKARRHEDQK